MDIRKNNKTNKKRSGLYFYNTLSRSIQQFKPIKKNRVGLYTCGPTVYSRAHIGNLRAYIFADILKRVLIKKGYKVKHVMNITDVGELTSEKNGFDKMLIGAKKENITTWQVAKKYTHLFFEDCKKLNILPPTIKCNATDHIKEQIELIERLEKKGYTYLNSDGVYFDTSKLNDYGKLARLNIKELKAGSRIRIGTKKSKTDFALWKFNKTSEEREMEWSSPWGKGFPGWHIECSAMSMKYLGEQFDIHTGGIDHISVHHTNEIAQSEAATGRIPFVNYWLHLDFAINSKEKMSKSIGNIKDLDTLKRNGIEPLAFRYLCLTAKYRHKLSIDNIELNSAQKSYEKLKLTVQKILTSSSNYSDNKKNKIYNKMTLKYKKEFEDAIFYDMNTSVGLATLWKLIKDPSLPNKEKQILISDFDEIFGFNFYDTLVKVEKLPDIIISLAKKREKFRKKGDWKNSDRIRDSLLKKGYMVNDVKNNYEIIKKNKKQSSNIKGRPARISITPACNLKCIYCGGSDGFKKGKPAAMEDFRKKPLKEGIIDTNIFIKIIKALHEVGFESIALTGGEPTLNQNWDCIIEESAKIGLSKNEITTNGTKLNDYMTQKKHLPRGLGLIKVSLDTPDPEEFARIKKGTNLEDVIKGIKAVNNVVRTRANKVVLRSDLGRIKDYIKWVKSLNFNEVLFLDLVYRPNFDSAEDATFFGKEYVPVNELIDYFQKQLNLTFFSSRYGHQTKLDDFKIILKDSNLTLRNDICEKCPIYCQEGLYTVRVASDGNITPCPDYNAELPSIDGVEALKNDTLVDQLIDLINIILSAHEEKTLKKFINRHKLKIIKTS